LEADQHITSEKCTFYTKYIHISHIHRPTKWSMHMMWGVSSHITSSVLYTVPEWKTSVFYCKLLCEQCMSQNCYIYSPISLYDPYVTGIHHNN
jgi:hypothetical protein